MIMKTRRITVRFSIAMIVCSDTSDLAALRTYVYVGGGSVDQTRSIAATLASAALFVRPPCARLVKGPGATARSLRQAPSNEQASVAAIPNRDNPTSKLHRGK